MANFIEAFAWIVVKSMPSLSPQSRPFRAAKRRMKRKTSSNTSFGRRLCDLPIDDWSGISSAVPSTRNSASDRLSANRHAMLRCDGRLSNYPTNVIRKETIRGIEGRPVPPRKTERTECRQRSGSRFRRGAGAKLFRTNARETAAGQRPRRRPRVAAPDVVSRVPCLLLGRSPINP